MGLFTKTSGKGWDFYKYDGMLMIYGHLECGFNSPFKSIAKKVRKIKALKGSSVSDGYSLFRDMENLVSADLAELDVSKCTDMDSMFFCCKSLVSLNLSTWNIKNVENMSSMFYCCESLERVKTGKGWIAENLTDAEGMFSHCRKLHEIDLSFLSSARLEDCLQMFEDCHSLEALDLSSVNVSNVRSMAFMFSGCNKLRTLKLGGWDARKDADMSYLFYKCSSLEMLDLTGWHIKNGINTNKMFSDISKNVKVIADDKSVVRLLPEEIKKNVVLGENAGADLLLECAHAEWNKDKTDYEKAMDLYKRAADRGNYAGAGKIGRMYINGWGTGKNYEEAAKWLLLADENGDKEQAEWLAYFYMNGIGVAKDYEKALPLIRIGAKKQEPWSLLNLGYLYENGYAVRRDPEEALKWYEAAQKAGSKNAPEYIEKLKKKAEEEKEKKKEAIKKALAAEAAIKEKAAAQKAAAEKAEKKQKKKASGKQETARKKPVKKESAEKQESVLKSENDRSDIITRQGWSFDKESGKLTISGDLGADLEPLKEVSEEVRCIEALSGACPQTCYRLFAGMTRLIHADLAELDVSKCINMEGMFEDCRSLTSLDLSKWNISNVIRMRRMFANCRKIESIKTGPGWNTSRLADVALMFDSCKKLHDFDMSVWSSAHLQVCQEMFKGCSAFEELDLRSMNVTAVLGLDFMFYGCHNLRTLNLAGWDTSKITYLNDIFDGCERLETLDLTGWHINEKAVIFDTNFENVPKNIRVLADDETIVRLLPEDIKPVFIKSADTVNVKTSKSKNKAATKKADPGNKELHKQKEEKSDKDKADLKNTIPEDAAKNGQTSADHIKKTRTRSQRNKTAADSQVATIAVLGHIGHGKTTLIKAITAVLEDEYGSVTSEDFKIPHILEDRGLIVESSMIKCETADRRYTLVDCPNLSDWVKILITEPNMFDGAILVVDCVDGPMAQTREMLVHMRELRLSSFVVFMSKQDMAVDDEIIDLTEMEIRELVGEYGFDGMNVPVIAGSALTALNAPDSSERDTILELLNALSDTVKPPVPASKKQFLFAVDGAVSIDGKGEAAFGRVERGSVKVGDELELIGLCNEAKRVTVKEINALRKSVDIAKPGDFVTILLSKVQPDEIKQGQVLAKHGSIGAHSEFEAEIYVRKPEEYGRKYVFFDGYDPQFYFRTIDLTGIARLPSRTEMVMPGDNIRISVNLIHPVAMERGTPFAILEGEHLVAQGFVTDLLD